MAVVLESLLALSVRDRGLATGDRRLRYLWGYGPVALMTLLVMGWAPVVYQAPAPAERSLLLNYLDMLLPLALARSLKNRDWAVASTLAVSMIFKVLVIFSAGLITLSIVDVTAPVPIMLQSAFVENNSTLAGDGDLVYKTMDGIAGGALAYYPDGTSTHFAYQAFQAAVPISSELQGTVEASEAGLVCSEATLELEESENVGYYYTTDGRGDLGNTFVVFAHLRSQTCHLNAEFGLKFDVSGTPTTVHLGRLLRGSCNGTNGPDGNRVGIISAIINYTVHDKRATFNYYATGNVDILRSTQLLCQPVFHIRQVDVVYNRTDEPRVNASTEAKTRTLEGVHPWDIMEAHFKSFWDNYDTIDASNGFSVSVDGQKIDVDRYTELAYKSFVPSTTDISALLDQNFLIDTFNEYYKRYAAQIVHRTILQTTSIPSTGSAPRAESRLVVDGLSCHLMAALLASVVFLICITLSPRIGVRGFPTIPKVSLGSLGLSATASRRLVPCAISGPPMRKTCSRACAADRTRSPRKITTIYQSQPSGHQPRRRLGAKLYQPTLTWTQGSRRFSLLCYTH